MNVVKSYFKEQFQLRMLFLEHSKPSDFYLSCWQTTRSSVPLLIWNVFLFLFSLGIVLASIILYIKAGLFSYWFIYLTHWGITLLVIATGFAAAVSARCYFYGPITAGAEFTLPWYVKTYWVFYNVAIPVAFLITLFYWTILYEAGQEEELNHGLDVAVHGLNSALMFLLLVSSSCPSRLLHFYQPLLFALAYVGFGVIFYLAGGHDPFGYPWVYPVVNWANPSTTVLVVFITGLILVIIHFITVALAEVRNSVTRALIKPSVIVHVDEGVPLRQRRDV